MKNYIDYYDLEKYLFDTVRTTFQKEKQLNAFDFFCIIIWKANRAKSKIANLLLKKGKDLPEQVKQLTSQIYNIKSINDKLSALMKDWGFRLPMASAILTVLYPDHFTIYDTRVCDILNKHKHIDNRKTFDSKLKGYLEYLEDVKNAEPKFLSLRDKDRYLWGKSFAEQLKKDIATSFHKTRISGSSAVHHP
jgi:hypothetical protein